MSYNELHDRRNHCGHLFGKKTVRMVGNSTALELQWEAWNLFCHEAGLQLPLGLLRFRRIPKVFGTHFQVREREADRQTITETVTETVTDRRRQTQLDTVSSTQNSECGACPSHCLDICEPTQQEIPLDLLEDLPRQPTSFCFGVTVGCASSLVCLIAVTLHEAVATLAKSDEGATPRINTSTQQAEAAPELINPPAN